jgi:hypothetical protein
MKFDIKLTINLNMKRNLIQFSKFIQRISMHENARGYFRGVWRKRENKKKIQNAINLFFFLPRRHFGIESTLLRICVTFRIIIHSGGVMFQIKNWKFSWRGILSGSFSQSRSLSGIHDSPYNSIIAGKSSISIFIFRKLENYQLSGKFN